MLDGFDYKEPSCALCGGKEFYAFDKDAPISRIPIKRILEKVDACFSKNDLEEAGRLLEHWKKEAIALQDRQGELSILSELIGYYRKTLTKEKALTAIDQALELVDKLNQRQTVSGATIILNCATTLKAFSLSQKAMPLYDFAEEIYLKNLDKKDYKLAGLFNNKALCLVDLKEYEKAEQYYLSAIGILEGCAGGKLDSAISLVNLAHLYEEIGQKKKVTDALFKAYEYLFSQDENSSGYYAYVLEKCAPSFLHFGYEKISNELTTLSKELYESN